MKTEKKRNLYQDNPTQQIFISEALIEYFSPKKNIVTNELREEKKEAYASSKIIISNLVSSFEDELDEYLDAKEKLKAIVSQANLDYLKKEVLCGALSSAEKNNMSYLSRYGDLNSEATSAIDRLVETTETNNQLAKEMLDVLSSSMELLETNVSSLEKKIIKKQKEWDEYLELNLIYDLWSPLERKSKLINGEVVEFQKLQHHYPYKCKDEETVSLTRRPHYDYKKILRFGERKKNITELLVEPFGGEFLDYSRYGLSQVKLDTYERTIFAATRFIMETPFYLKKHKDASFVNNKTYQSISNYVANNLSDHIERFPENKATNSEHLIWNQFMIWLNKTVNKPSEEDESCQVAFVKHLKEQFGVKNEQLIDYSSIVDNKKDITAEEKINFYFYMYQDLLDTYENSEKNQDEKLSSWLNSWSSTTFLRDYQILESSTGKEQNMKFLKDSAATAPSMFFSLEKENNYFLVVFKAFFYQETKNVEFSIDNHIEKRSIEKKIETKIDKKKTEKNSPMRF